MDKAGTEYILMRWRYSDMIEYIDCNMNKNIYPQAIIMQSNNQGPFSVSCSE